MGRGRGWGGFSAVGEGQPGRGRGFGRRVCSGGPRPRAGVLCPLRCGEIGTKEAAGGGGRFAGSGCLPHPPLRASPPPRPAVPLPRRAAGTGPLDASGYLKLAEEAGVLASPRVVRRTPGSGVGARVLATFGAHFAGGELRTGRCVWCRVSSVMTARRGHDWVLWSPVLPPPSPPQSGRPELLLQLSLPLQPSPRGLSPFLSLASLSSLVEWGRGRRLAGLNERVRGARLAPRLHVARAQHAVAAGAPVIPVSPASNPCHSACPGGGCTGVYQAPGPEAGE